MRNLKKKLLRILSFIIPKKKNSFLFIPTHFKKNKLEGNIGVFIKYLQHNDSSLNFKCINVNKDIAENADRTELTFDKEFQIMSAANQKPDGVLLPLVEKELSREVDSNRLIVVHLMGSHTNYCHRYPPEFEVYKMGALEKFWMRLTKGGIGHSVACYENSILYNDYVVSEIVKMLETKTEGNVSAMMYFADHSEDITRGKGHSSASFSYEMIESPAIVWLSDEYRAKYADKYQTINANINQLFPNDYVFDSLIGLAGIRAESEFYCEECDITSSKYLLEPDKARTMHDRLPYVTEDNPFSEPWR